MAEEKKKENEMTLTQDGNDFIKSVSSNKSIVAFDGQTLRNSMPEGEDIAFTSSAINPINVLLSEEPDFMKNTYTVYILLRTLGEGNGAFYKPLELSNSQSNTDYIKTDFTKQSSNDFSMFAIRLDGIKFPQKKAQTSIYKFLGRDVPVVNPKFDVNRHGSLTLRLDQNMYTLDNMSMLSNDYSTMTTDYDKLSAPKWWTAQDATYTSNFFPMLYSSNSKEYSFNGVSTFTKGSKPRIDLIIDTMTNTALAHSIPDYKATRWRYVLSDVRFLGRSSNLTFNDSANAQSATFDYIFKRQYKMKLQYKEKTNLSSNGLLYGYLTPNSLPTLC